MRHHAITQTTTTPHRTNMIFAQTLAHLVNTTQEALRAFERKLTKHSKYREYVKKNLRLLEILKPQANIRVGDHVLSLIEKLHSANLACQAISKRLAIRTKFKELTLEAENLQNALAAAKKALQPVQPAAAAVVSNSEANSTNLQQLNPDQAKQTMLRFVENILPFRGKMIIAGISDSTLARTLSATLRRLILTTMEARFAIDAMNSSNQQTLACQWLLSTQQEIQKALDTWTKTEKEIMKEPERHLKTQLLIASAWVRPLQNTCRDIEATLAGNPLSVSKTTSLAAGTHKTPSKSPQQSSILTHTATLFGQSVGRTESLSHCHCSFEGDAGTPKHCL